MMDTFVKTSRIYNTKSEAHVNYELWLIIVCLNGFISCNTCTTLMQDANIGRGLHRKSPHLLFNFSVNLKFLSRNKLIYMTICVYIKRYTYTHTSPQKRDLVFGRGYSYCSRHTCKKCWGWGKKRTKESSQNHRHLDTGSVAWGEQGEEEDD